jgi:hypothetical protein
MHILCDFLFHEEAHRWIIDILSEDTHLCRGELLLSRLCSMVQVRVLPLRLDPVSIDAFQNQRPGTRRSSAGYLVQTIMQGLAAVADSCVTWMLPDLINRTGLLKTLMSVTELSCAMLLHEKIAESHSRSCIQLLCTAVRGLCGCMFESAFALQIQSARIHGALFLLLARMMEKNSLALERFPRLPIIRVTEGRVYFDSDDCLQMDSLLGFAVADVISGETPSRFFFEFLLHGATEFEKIDVMFQLENDEDNLNSRYRTAATIQSDGVDVSCQASVVILMFINCLWSREHIACCSAGPVILRALAMSQLHFTLPASVRGAAMKALSLSLKPGNSAISFIFTKVLNIFPSIFANGFNFPPPPGCIAEPALQVRMKRSKFIFACPRSYSSNIMQVCCFLSLDPSFRPQLLTIDIIVALAQWLKVAPKSQDTSRDAKDLLSVGQSEDVMHAPIFVSDYDPRCALRCRALAASALICLFSSSVDPLFAEAILATPLCETLLRTVSLNITPIFFHDNTANHLSVACTSKIVQHLSLCSMAMLSSHQSIALAWSDNEEFKDLILRLLSEGQPDFKPFVITLFSSVCRFCPRFIQKLFSDESKVGPQAIGSVVRSIWDYLAEYSQRCGIFPVYVVLVTPFTALESNWLMRKS